MGKSVLVMIVTVLAKVMITTGQQGLTLSLRGRSIAAGSDLSITDVGEYANGAALICTTDLQDCCNSAASGGARRGNWIFSNGSYMISGPRNGGNFYVTRSPERQVRLQRRSCALSPLGLYCCEVETMAHIITGTTICVNLVAVSPQLPTAVLSGSGPQTAGESYTLICTAGVGSTPSTYQWTKGGTLITTSSTQILQNATDTSSQTLTFSPLEEADTGVYTCTVTRDSITTCTTARINVEIPTVSVMVSGSGDPTEDRQYTLICTVSGHQALMATVTYQWLNNSNFITQSQTNRQYTFNPVDRYDNGTYTCQATVNSSLLSSNIVRQNSIIIQVAVLLPAQPSLTVTLQGSRSIGFSWTQPSSGSRVESYTVHYTATERDCNYMQSQGVDMLDETQSSFTFSNLEENSDVTIIVTAINIRGNSSSNIAARTNTASPSGIIQNLRAFVANSTSIAVTWNELNCVDRNGVISGYRIEYGTTTFDNMEIVSATSFTATGLVLLTSYIFRVAAINSNGTGPHAVINATLFSLEYHGPRQPDMISAIPFQTTTSISWSFITSLDSRNETYTVMYGTTPEELSMRSPLVLSTPSVQQYSVQLVSLQPGFQYYYQLNSTNRFYSTTSEISSFRTLDARSTEVRSVNSETPDNMTLILNWQVPVHTNGDILHYLVRVTLNLNNSIITEESVMDTRFTTTGLSPGVPYDVSITPVNSIGLGDPHSSTHFTQEFAPNVAVQNVTASRSFSNTMSVSWTPLTLSEARGVVTYYSIAHSPTPSSRRRQASQDTMYVNASGNSSSVSIQGLDESLAYSVTVAAATRAGIGVRSSAVIVTPSTSKTSSEAIIGGIVAAVFTVLFVTFSTVIILAVVMRGKKTECRKNTSNKESEQLSGMLSYKDSICDETVRREFTLQKCPAYTTRGRKQGDVDQIYETVA